MPSRTGSQLFSLPVLILPAIYTWPDTFPSLTAWMNVFALGFFSTAIAFIIYYYLVKAIGATRSSLVTYLIPVFAIMWGVLLLDEPLTLQIIVGGTIILLGVSLTTGLLGVFRSKQA